MSQSNFPSGFANGITIRELPLQVAHPGKVYWVNNSAVLAPNGIVGSDGNKGDFLKPFASLKFAISKCVAARGDIIMVMPGHIEAVTAASMDLTIQGIAIIGIGQGDLRPTLNFGATSSNIAISAADCSIKNIVAAATIDQVVAGFTISAEGCTLDIETKDTAANKEFVSPIVCTAGAANLRIKARHRGFATGSHMTRYMDLVGVVDANIDVDFYGTASTAVVSMRTTACKNVKVSGRFYNATGALSFNVTDTASSKWAVYGMDDLGGNEFAGSDTAVIAYISGGTAANQTAIQNAVLAMPIAFATTAKVLGTGNTTLFTITGGPIKILEVVGIVTTIVQAQATSCKLQAVTTTPSATVDMSAAAVDLTGAAAGASIRHINTTGVLTVVTAGFVNEGNAFATQDTPYLVPIGSIQLNNASAANTGAITWYLRYVPLSPLSRVA